MSTTECEGQAPTCTLKIRLFEQKDAAECANIWVTGLNQTVQSSSILSRPLFRWAMTNLAASATAPDGDMGPDGCNLHKEWGVAIGANETQATVVDRALFVAENEEGEVVGLCCVKRGIGDKDIPAVDFPVFSIWRMSVSEKARRLKVGSRLMSACEDWAVARGGNKMTLVTGNSFASSFYKNIGYATINFWGIRHEKNLVVKS